MAAVVIAGKVSEETAELQRKLEQAEARARKAEQTAAERELDAKTARNEARAAAKQKSDWLAGMAPSRVGMFGRR